MPPLAGGRYVLLRLLGKGGFSEVFHAYDTHEGREVACKIHQLAAGWSEERRRAYVRHAVREYDIHKRLDHPHIVALHDIFEVDSATFCTVLSFCGGGDLDAHLRAHGPLPEREARAVLVQLFSALAYLNDDRAHRRIIHYDLKARLFFYGGSGQQGGRGRRAVEIEPCWWKKRGGAS